MSIQKIQSSVFKTPNQLSQNRIIKIICAREIFSHAGIQEFCTDLTFKNDSLRAFGRWVRHVFGSDDDECADVNYDNVVSSLSDVNSNSQARAGNYLYCTQFGLNFRITPENGFGGVFPAVITQEYHDQWCQDIFGDA